MIHSFTPSIIAFGASRLASWKEITYFYCHFRWDNCHSHWMGPGSNQVSQKIACHKHVSTRAFRVPLQVSCEGSIIFERVSFHVEGLTIHLIGLNSTIIWGGLSSLAVHWRIWFAGQHSQPSKDIKSEVYVHRWSWKTSPLMPIRQSQREKSKKSWQPRENRWTGGFWLNPCVVS